MYPPVETPTSPDDQTMVILDGIKKIPTPEQIPKMPRNPFKISSDSLKKNIDGRNDNEIKRTSLKIEPTTLLDEAELVYRNKRLSLNDKDLILAMSKRKSAPPPPPPTLSTALQDHLDNEPSVTSGGQPITAVVGEKDENENYYDVLTDGQIDNKNQRIMDYGFVGANNNKNVENDDRNSMTTQCDENEEDRAGSSCSSDENKNRDSIESGTSSTAESNDDERRLLFSVDHNVNPVEAMDMLSPDEGPLARRYAEIAQFKINPATANGAAEMANNCNKWPDPVAQSRTTNKRFAFGVLDNEEDSRDSILNNSLQHDTVDDCDDDLQALLPAQDRRLSRDELSQSRTSLVSSSDGGILAEGETSSDTSDGSESPPCDLGLVERLLRTHPVWFLPGIQRAGAVHLLQGKEEGNFVVRGSSQSNTMAVSVRLPLDTGPYIEHYLIQSNDGILSLESSRFKFDSIPALIAHYAQCCDELPVQLSLPRALRDAKNRQQLSSLALLGQEFWRYPMAGAKSEDTKSDQDHSLDRFDSNNNNHNSKESPGTSIRDVISSINPPKAFVNSNFGAHVETPSDTTSSLSSFTISQQQQQQQASISSGQHQMLMSPESIDSVILTMSPVESCRSGIVGKTSTFKAQVKSPLSQTNSPPPSLTNSESAFFNNYSSPPLNSSQTAASSSSQQSTTNIIFSNVVNGTEVTNVVRAPRPTPPNTLNLIPIRTPPAPPPRWSKPPTPTTQSNFSVTTTFTFNVEGGSTTTNSPQIVEIISPATTPIVNETPMQFHTISKRLSPEGGECRQNMDTISSSKRWQPQTSRDSSKNQKKMISPILAETPTSRSRRKVKSSKSKHYQESDILESPSIYCRSALGDKISDYEDIWTQENNNGSTSTPINRGGSTMSSFRPDISHQKPRPDLIQETQNVVSLNGNLLSPASSVNNSTTSSSPAPPSTKLETVTTRTTLVQQQIAIIENQTNANNSKSMASDNLISHLISPQEGTQRFGIYHKNLQSFTNPPTPTAANGETSPNPMLQPRNRFGVILTQANGQPLDVPMFDPGTPTQNGTASKQGSPFYAEPADSLSNPIGIVNIIKRAQKNTSVPSSQRFSEPPKGPLIPFKNGFMNPAALNGMEKNPLSGSLDELKKRNRKARGRLDPWPLDSSWEFVGNEDNDCDTEVNVKNQPKIIANNDPNKENVKLNNIPIVDSIPKQPLTIHQIIAQKLPELELPEPIYRSSTPIQNSNTNGGTILRGQRVSAYDNVERNLVSSYGYATTASLLLGENCAQSDDGTVFSEPWDSSQWDNFLHHDDTSETIHFSKCKPACLSEDDTTILEDMSLISKDNNPARLPPPGASKHPKVATIFRSRSCRDREILCHPRNKTSSGGGPGESVGSYALSLADDPTSTFSRNIENFITCTKDSREMSPQIMMRNMRQFMSGMKNYLVKHGEADFHQEVQRACSRLKPDEFLNLDTILEGVMHKLVVLPLRQHLYGLFVDYYTKSADIQVLVDNVKFALGKTPVDIGIRKEVIPPTDQSMRNIALIIQRLQEAELPLEKLELLMAAVSTIFETTGCPKGQALNADDFLPLLVYVVAKTGFVGAEIEAEFMWGLLQPSLLSGEAGYYLTALCSAVHVLKTFKDSQTEGSGTIDWRSSSMPTCSSVLRVIIPDEYNGSLQTRTLPVRPHTTTKEVCRIIAHKARITNPQDYGLFQLVDGEETLLTDVECPQDARLKARGKHCLLAYKRIEAKIAWPSSASFH